jgi:hypothetical protein
VFVFKRGEIFKLVMFIRVADDFSREKAQRFLKSVMTLFSSELPKICSST